jgi:hypothetical protein
MATPSKNKVVSPIIRISPDGTLKVEYMFGRQVNADYWTWAEVDCDACPTVQGLDYGRMNLERPRLERKLHFFQYHQVDYQHQFNNGPQPE